MVDAGYLVMRGLILAGHSMMAGMRMPPSQRSDL
jgi:hypothetical protein